MNLKHFFLFLGVERFNNALPHAVGVANLPSFHSVGKEDASVRLDH
jgi:hypothetical protein